MSSLNATPRPPSNCKIVGVLVELQTPLYCWDCSHLGLETKTSTNQFYVCNGERSLMIFDYYLNMMFLLASQVGRGQG